MLDCRHFHVKSTLGSTNIDKWREKKKHFRIQEHVSIKFTLEKQEMFAKKFLCVYKKSFNHVCSCIIDILNELEKKIRYEVLWSIVLFFHNK